LALLAGAAVMTWTQRYSCPEGDPMSYVDMAAKTLREGPSNLISTYWGAGYPAFITIVLGLFHSGIRSELPLVHVLNFLIFLASGVCLAWFVREWIRLVEPQSPETSPESVAPFRLWAPLISTLLFGWVTAFVTAIYLVTPDLSILCAVLCAAAICCRIERQPSRLNWALLGLALGMGAYFKSPVFIIAGMLLALVAYRPPDKRAIRWGPAIAISVFAVTVAPYVAAISAKAGHPSFGETGGLAYIWYLNGDPDQWNVYDVWSGKEVNGTRAVHPARTVLQDPLVIEFAEPIHSTYPLWYDPFYWSEGVRPRVNLRDEAKVLANVPDVLINLITGPAWLVCTAMWIWLLYAARRNPRYWLLVKPWMIVWPLGVLAMYLLIHVEDRFLGGFLLVWLIGGLTAAYYISRRGFAFCLALLCIAIVLPLLPQALARTGRFTRLNPATGRDSLVTVGDSLLKLGVRQGDVVATCGNSFNSYWARAAGVRVISQIVQCNERGGFTAANAPVVFQKLSELGVAGVVAIDVPSDFAGAKWVPLGRTRFGTFSAHMLKP
jgi:hypothetical protein